MKKKWIAMLLAGIMAVTTLSGCSAKEESKEPEASKVEESKVEASKTEESKTEESKEEVKDYTGQKLRIGWWGGDARNEQTMTIIEEFEKQYPGLTVEVEFAGFGDYFTRLNTQAAGGELPDVMQMDVGKIYTFADNAQLMDLTSFIEDGSIDTANVSESAVKMGEVCDGIYGVACGMNGLTYLYNPEILEEAGCTLSMEPTMSEIIEVAKTVYEKTGSRIHSFGNNGEIFYRSLGGDLYANGEDAFGYTEEMMLEWAEIQYDAISDDYISTANNSVEANNGAKLAAGEIWLVAESSNQIVSYEDASGKTLEMVTQARADDATVEDPTYLKPAMLWSVAADTELAELAVAFIDYYTNSTSVYDVCGIDRGVPISSAIRDYLLPNLSEADQKSFAYVDYLSENSTPMNLYTPAKAAEANAPISELFEKIIYQTMEKEELPELVHEAYEKASSMISAAE